MFSFWSDLVLFITILSTVWFAAKYIVLKYMCTFEAHTKSNELKKLACECDMHVREITQLSQQVISSIRRSLSTSSAYTNILELQDALHGVQESARHLDVKAISDTRNVLGVTRPADFEKWETCISPLMLILQSIRVLPYQEVGENERVQMEGDWTREELVDLKRILSQLTSKGRGLRSELLRSFADDYRNMTQTSPVRLWSVVSYFCQPVRMVFSKISAAFQY